MVELNEYAHYYQSIEPPSKTTTSNSYILSYSTSVDMNNTPSYYPDDYFFLYDNHYPHNAQSPTLDTLNTNNNTTFSNENASTLIEDKPFIEYKVDLQEKAWQKQKKPKRLHEIRRQDHIKSEKRRRMEISQGFEVLKKLLPGCQTSKKLSKATLLTRAVQQLKYMHKTQNDLLTELELLLDENSMLRRQLTMTPC